MRNRFAVVVAVSAVSLGAATSITSCSFGNGSFACQVGDNAACGGGGVCQPDGFCSLPDSTCTGTSQRYGDQSGPNSGKCVPLPTGSGGPDAGIPDAFVPPDAATFCYGTGIVHVCFASAPTGTFTVDAVGVTTVDTDTSTACATTLSGATSYCVIAAADINIITGLKATGSKPLVLLAVHSITSSAASFIDVGSNRDTSSLGAGHDPAGCPDVAVGAPADGGGGAGGSFMSQGGAGGRGKGPGAGGTAGAALTAAPTTLRGGCAGQNGQGVADTAGHGGGAVFFIAGTSIQMDGVVLAGGEGGKGGQSAANASTTNGAGGGGAGAGGMIGFDAPTVVATNGVIANGGGGGEGGSGASADGNSGADATGTSASKGGSTGTTSGGDGGDGSVNGTKAGGPGLMGADAGNPNGFGGGGGGGGGAGFIVASKGANLGKNVSPPATILQ
jgi:hypothetical protein